MDDSADSGILSQEQWSNELLARETHIPIEKVQEVFLVEYMRPAAHAISRRTFPYWRATA
jgi:hypothetical protein